MLDGCVGPMEGQIILEYDAFNELLISLEIW